LSSRPGHCSPHIRDDVTAAANRVIVQLGR
jgi:hypothetical protein